MLTAVDHVQLAARGGCRFAAGPVRPHLGVRWGSPRTKSGAEPRPVRKAHPGLRVTGIAAHASRLEEHGAKALWFQEPTRP
ncbi:hypothetical protein ACGFYU_21365 [Streptomyces sp. NPDC048337]|uniref:hypothetical protein n=1 Tax=Streptomyces sp. NPDC048337 TaxID=3365535 RepID=UPI0037191EA4